MAVYAFSSDVVIICETTKFDGCVIDIAIRPAFATKAIYFVLNPAVYDVFRDLSVKLMFIIIIIASFYEVHSLLRV